MSVNVMAARHKVIQAETDLDHRLMLFTRATNNGVTSAEARLNLVAAISDLVTAKIEHELTTRHEGDYHGPG